MVIKKFDADTLIALAKDASQDGRQELASRISDFFENRLTDEEEKLASDILIGLIKQAEMDYRASLSQKLSRLENVPRSVILALADEDISVASHVIRNSMLLYDADFLMMIKTKTDAYWQEIAQRQRLSALIIDSLADTDHIETARYLVKNQHIHIPKSALKKIAYMGITDQGLQRHLLSRNEIDNSIAAYIYICVSKELRQDLEKKFSLNETVLEKAMHETLTDFLTAPDPFFEGDVVMSERIMQFARYAIEEQEVLNSSVLIKALRRGHVQYFLALLSLWVRMSPESVLALLNRENGDGLAVFCRSENIEKTEFASLFLLTGELRNEDEVSNHVALAKALKVFEGLTFQDAKRLLSLWKDRPEMM